ncbi:MAG TPA: hypothetical protein VMW57_09230 [Methyloceanibacter sp.]|nr:hypothetical protein [Methyloceanibacter sp.]
MSEQTRRPTVERPAPGRMWYAAAVLVALAGFAVAGYRVYSSLDDLMRGMAQVVVPGEAVLALEPGRYTIFHEYQSAVGGRIYSGTDISGLLVRVAPADGGTPLDLDQTGATSSYELGSHAGRSVLAFDVPQAGDYRLVASYPGGEAKPEAVLAVGRGMTGGILSLVFSALAIVFLSVAAAAAIVIMTYRRRRAALSPR